MKEYLDSTYFIDWHSDIVGDFVSDAVGSVVNSRDKAIRLFNAVRDGLWYDPYSVNPVRENYRASVILQQTAAYCVPKAIVMAAAGRAAGLPTRLGFADVRNHLATPRLLEQLGTDIFAFHGFTEIYLEDRWVKVTPTFNSELCERFGVLPLEFDGFSDALFQPFDAAGRRHMEYIRDRGSFADFPFEEMLRVYAEVYPSLGGGLEAEEDGLFGAT
jgi:transglutaminase-like putative cysteine protease